MWLKKLVAERDLEIEVMKEIAAKNGERAGSPEPSRVCDEPRPIATAGLHAVTSCAFCADVPIASGREGRADCGVIPPFLTGFDCRTHAAICSFSF